MSTSVVISQIVPADDGISTHVKGTVGGTAFLTAFRNFKYDPISLSATPNSIGAMFLAKYNLINTQITALASSTVNVPILDSKTSVVAFGSTPVAFVGYDYLEVTATVDGVTTVLHVQQDNFIEKAGAAVGMGVWLGTALWGQAKANAQAAALISTFSI